MEYTPQEITDMNTMLNIDQFEMQNDSWQGTVNSWVGQNIGNQLGAVAGLGGQLIESLVSGPLTYIEGRMEQQIAGAAAIKAQNQAWAINRVIGNYNASNDMAKAQMKKAYGLASSLSAATAVSAGLATIGWGYGWLRKKWKGQNDHQATKSIMQRIQQYGDKNFYKLNAGLQDQITDIKNQLEQRRKIADQYRKSKGLLDEAAQVIQNQGRTFIKDFARQKGRQYYGKFKNKAYQLAQNAGQQFETAIGDSITSQIDRGTDYVGGKWGSLKNKIIHKPNKTSKKEVKQHMDEIKQHKQEKKRERQIQFLLETPTHGL